MDREPQEISEAKRRAFLETLEKRLELQQAISEEEAVYQDIEDQLSQHLIDPKETTSLGEQRELVRESLSEMREQLEQLDTIFADYAPIYPIILSEFSKYLDKLRELHREEADRTGEDDNIFAEHVQHHTEQLAALQALLKESPTLATAMFTDEEVDAVETTEFVTDVELEEIDTEPPEEAFSQEELKEEIPDELPTEELPDEYTLPNGTVLERQRAKIFYLLKDSSEENPVPAEDIYSHIWPNVDEKKGSKRLSVHLSELRKELENSRFKLVTVHAKKRDERAQYYLRVGEEDEESESDEEI